MLCKCKDCGTEYDNLREYQTSICDECFKMYNENNLQPLKDHIHKLEIEINNLKDTINTINNLEEYKNKLNNLNVIYGKQTN